MKLPNIFIPEKDLGENIERFLKEEKPSIQPKYIKFKVIHTNTYAEGIAKLREQSRKPFTLSENIEARILDYEVNGKNAKLFKTWLDSITGIVYKVDSTKFKLILRCSRLENIKSDFNQSFILVDYNVENGIELDSKKGKYNQLLTRKEAKNHEFWLAVMNSDKEKLAKYVNIWFDKTGKDKGMGVYLRGNTSQDELRALAFHYVNNNSYAYGDYDLSDYARFVSGAKQK